MSVRLSWPSTSILKSFIQSNSFIQIFKLFLFHFRPFQTLVHCGSGCHFIAFHSFHLLCFPLLLCSLPLQHSLKFSKFSNQYFVMKAAYAIHWTNFEFCLDIKEEFAIVGLWVAGRSAYKIWPDANKRRDYNSVARMENFMALQFSGQECFRFLKRYTCFNQP